MPCKYSSPNLPSALQLCEVRRLSVGFVAAVVNPGASSWLPARAHRRRDISALYFLLVWRWRHHGVLWRTKEGLRNAKSVQVLLSIHYCRESANRPLVQVYSYTLAVQCIIRACLFEGTIKNYLMDGSKADASLNRNLLKRTIRMVKQERQPKKPDKQEKRHRNCKEYSKPMCTNVSYCLAFGMRSRRSISRDWQTWVAWVGQCTLCPARAGKWWFWWGCLTGQRRGIRLFSSSWDWCASRHMRRAMSRLQR